MTVESAENRNLYRDELCLHTFIRNHLSSFSKLLTACYLLFWSGTFEERFQFLTAFLRQVNIVPTQLWELKIFCDYVTMYLTE